MGQLLWPRQVQKARPGCQCSAQDPGFLSHHLSSMAVTKLHKDNIRIDLGISGLHDSQCLRLVPTISMILSAWVCFQPVKSLYISDKLLLASGPGHFVEAQSIGLLPSQFPAVPIDVRKAGIAVMAIYDLQVAPLQRCQCLAAKWRARRHRLAIVLVNLCAMFI